MPAQKATDANSIRCFRSTSLWSQPLLDQTGVAVLWRALARAIHELGAVLGGDACYACIALCIAETCIVEEALLIQRALMHTRSDLTEAEVHQRTGNAYAYHDQNHDASPDQRLAIWFCRLLQALAFDLVLRHQVNGVRGL